MPKSKPEEDENGWSVGYLYKDPDYKPGESLMERGEVTWHHIWTPPPAKTEPKEDGEQR